MFMSWIQAIKLLGGFTADQLYEMKVAGNEQQYEQICSDALFKTYLLRVRAETVLIIQCYYFQLQLSAIHIIFVVVFRIILYCVVLKGTLLSFNMNDISYLLLKRYHLQYDNTISIQIRLDRCRMINTPLLSSCVGASEARDGERGAKDKEHSTGVGRVRLPQ